ncbi:hypothetical protein OIU84_001086, partial [Salix udensis]
MADHQKIHPLNTRDVEAPQAPTVPLVPPGSSASDKGDPAAHTHYPPFQRTIPVIHTKPPRKRRSCCCRFFCWTFSLLLLLVLVIGLIAGTLYLVFQPKLPKFSIDSLQITRFNLTSNSSLSATFNVTITAKNPNKKGHRNTTVLNVILSGQTDDGSTLLTSLQQQQQQTGTIPLNLRVNQPVRIKLGKLKLMKVKFRARCRLDIDSLSVNNAITIRN